MKYIHAIDKITNQVRLADFPAGPAGPWEDASAWVFPFGLSVMLTAEPRSAKTQPAPGIGQRFLETHYQPAARVLRCECGSDSIGGGGHSDWCPKHPGQGVP